MSQAGWIGEKARDFIMTLKIVYNLELTVYFWKFPFNIFSLVS
jgi:hypothetical protein